MLGRPTILFPLALLALLALLTLWIERSVQPPEHKLDGSNRHDPDYILNYFTTTRTDVNGDLKYVLSAAEMKHYPDDDSTELKKPHFTQYSVDKPYTQIEGDRGFVSSNGENVQFIGNVKVVRQAFKDRGEMTVTTTFLNIVPDKELATTDKAVVIRQAPETVIHAVGMIYNKKLKTLELHSRVRAHYVKPAPTGRKSNAPRPTYSKQPVKKPSASSASSENVSPQSPSKKLPTSKPDNQADRSVTKPANNSTRIRRTYEPASP